MKCLEKSVGIDWWNFGKSNIREIVEIVITSGGQLYNYPNY